MDKVLVNKDDLVALANSIRTKSAVSQEMTVAQMKINVDSIPSYIDGQFFPFDVTYLAAPHITITYNGEEV